MNLFCRGLKWQWHCHECFQAPREGTIDLETPSGQQLWGNPCACCLFVLQGGPERCCRAGCQQGAWQSMMTTMTTRGGSSSVAAAGPRLGLLRPGGQALWQRVLEGAAEKDTLGCSGAFVGTSFHSRCMAGQEKFMYFLEGLCNYWATPGELCYDRNSSKWPTYFILLIRFRAQKRISPFFFFSPKPVCISKLHSKVIFNYKEV